MRHLIVLVIVACIFQACPSMDGHSGFEIVNLTDKWIYFGGVEGYPDTFDCGDRGQGKTIFIPIAPRSSRLNPALNQYWEYDLNYGRTISIFIFDGEAYDKYWKESCDTIRKYVPVLQQYEISLKVLQELDWKITYPPTEAMKNVRMNPPYKQE